ncbi:MAG: NADPH-dependent F420 reductase [Nitrososphaerota archaeon]|nr:NADPH-dependent F420 reductase [Nitrososphaerota archaeon]MDG7023798.1 NADPH-dependent F420 reductase [Nitrososphaerota archaeon]
MKIAVLGGTGKMGMALAGKLAGANEVIIGSRDPARAREAAKKIRGATGTDYEGASKEADAVVVAVPASALGTLAPLAKALAGKLVISAVNPLRFEGGLAYPGREEGSAAEELAKALPRSRVSTAFNNIPAGFLRGGEAAPVDVLVAADSKEAYEETAGVVKSVPNLRPLYAGPLSQAGVVESMTALVLNLASLNKTGSLTTKFVSRKGWP